MKFALTVVAPGVTSVVRRAPPDTPYLSDTKKI